MRQQQNPYFDVMSMQHAPAVKHIHTWMEPVLIIKGRSRNISMYDVGQYTFDFKEHLVV
jgi:hypothetical protein